MSLAVTRSEPVRSRVVEMAAFSPIVGLLLGTLLGIDIAMTFLISPRTVATMSRIVPAGDR